MNEAASTYRKITYRSLPGSQGKAKKLAGLAGTCRFIWNVLLAQQNEAYEKAMMRSAKGTTVSPSTIVKQKSGLDCEILKTGWGQLNQIPDHKCLEVIKVRAAYTSQRCYLCGHTEAGNRTTQSKFECVASSHVDLNAATYILASGIGATARRGAFGLPTPKTREMDVWGTT